MEVTNTSLNFRFPLNLEPESGSNFGPLMVLENETSKIGTCFNREELLISELNSAFNSPSFLKQDVLTFKTQTSSSFVEAWFPEEGGLFPLTNYFVVTRKAFAQVSPPLGTKGNSSPSAERDIFSWLWGATHMAATEKKQKCTWLPKISGVSCPGSLRRIEE